MTGPEFPGFNQGGKALIGSPNGSSTAWMLAQHSHVCTGKVEDRVMINDLGSQPGRNRPEAQIKPYLPILNLSEQEKRAFGYLFNQADSDQLGVVTGERAVAFFERTKVSPNVLGEIWQIADTENRGLLTKPGFCMVLRLIGHYQAGRVPSAELAFKPAPVPKFDGLQIPGVGPAPQQVIPSPTGGGFPANVLQPQLSGTGPIRVPPLDPQKMQQYAGLFERSGAQQGMLDGATAKSIFERAGLPNEVLGKIWTLSDREQRGALDQTEFIVAMHLLTSMKTRAMLALPNTLPPGLYEAAARRGVPGPLTRQGTGPPVIPRQFTGGSAGAPARTQSPLARPPGYATPPAQPAQTTGTPWLITQQEKAKYDQFFATIDTVGRGIITGEQAVHFFSDSRLPEDTLATIWDLSDINSEGQLNKDEFAVAMYLIRQQRSPNPAPLPAFLPTALVPPSMRQQQQSAQSTAPTFDNAANTSHMPKSATEDLFGLDEPSPPQAQQPQLSAFQPQTTGLQTQTTGASATRDPFGGSVPGSPSSPQRFQPPPQQASTGTMFKPFMPTSAFGASIAQQHTGGSTTSSQGQARGFPQQQQAPHSHLQQATAMDDLLGDNDAHAEESNRLTTETTELANMSNQIGNLRTQMEQTQSKKSATQTDLTATTNQKRDLELRLQQFRSQYETEVRTVKELDTQLTTSRESTKKLGQDLAMLEGMYQDLQTQHNSVAQALQADQQENANLKQKIGQINAEVTRLKPEIEKMKLEARQQKGLVSINRKQLATNEGEKDRLQGEKGNLEREAAEREEQARNAPQEPQQSHFGRDAAIGAGAGAAAFGGYEAMKDRGVTSPSGAGSNLASPSGLSSTNPFFRKASAEGSAERAMSPPATSSTGPTPSAFDAIFGPSAAFSPSGQAGSRAGTPPTTSFGRSAAAPTDASHQQASAPHAPGMTDSIQSVSSVGEPTPSATPPLSVGTGTKDSPQIAEPPPPVPENKQFTAGQLPLGGLPDRTRDDDEIDSVAAAPPASRAGGTETPGELTEREMPGAFEGSTEEPPLPTPAVEELPGAFPSDEEQSTASAKELPAEEPAASAEPQASHLGRDAAIGAGAGAAAFGGYEAMKDPHDQPTSAAAAQPKDDFDSAFDGFGEGEQTKDAHENDEDPFAPSSGQQQGQAYSSEFPPIRALESEDDESSDEEGERGGFDDDFAAGSPPRNQAPVEPISAVAAGPSSLAPPTSFGETSTAGARPVITSMPSAASTLPGIESQQSPPTYEQSNEPSYGGTGERSSSNQFPPEFGGLLPSREDPTSPSAPAVDTPEQAVVAEKEIDRPTTGTGTSAEDYQTPQTSGTWQSLFASVQTPSTTDVFHDASSRPISSVTDMTPERAQPGQRPSVGQSRNAFDDFDEFDDLSEAKEADKSVGDPLDFGFGRSQSAADEFNPAFDSPAASMTNTMASSSQQTPTASNRQVESSNGFANFQPNASSSDAFGESSGADGASSIQHTPQNVQHDWDAIFSGIDSNKGVDTSLSTGAARDDPWGAPAVSSAASNGASAAERTPTAASPVSERTTRAAPASSQTQQQPPTGRALTPGTEHDDPFLKRLTGMGYPRAEALNALEMYDYDVNKAIDHLSGS
ncbi:hypothetical protein LTR36_000384 [Oleoguttula mirabilis]|uniref:Uncharacterized protein n=1 Tax=Oleoguttula mirabilis TaxID=1507867 RepID=A0AAV9JYR4_9PEZI|nr:hypothetical protein LTR36_000384 [Oleoguttula mirabilis]